MPFTPYHMLTPAEQRAVDARHSAAATAFGVRIEHERHEVQHPLTAPTPPSADVIARTRAAAALLEDGIPPSQWGDLQPL